MTRNDFKIKLQLLIKEFAKEHGLSDLEIDAITTSIMTIVYSDIDTRHVWYREMRKISSMIAEDLKERGEAILSSLNITEEEKEKFRRMFEHKKKVEN